MKKTLVVNLLGGPGVGKSTMTAAVFAKLKNLGIDCEMASEFAKELVWEQRNETFKDELYIFAKQAHRLFRLKGKVDVVVTDRPLILTCFYAKDDPDLKEFCYKRFSEYLNLNILLTREKEYNPNGRNQTEDEAKEIDKGIIEILNKYNIPYQTVLGKPESADAIVSKVIAAMESLKDFT